MSAQRRNAAVSAKTRALVKKLVRETKQDPVLSQIAKPTRVTSTSNHYLKKRAEIMSQGLAQLGILEHCIMLSENKVAMLTDYLGVAPKPTAKRRKNK